MTADRSPNGFAYRTRKNGDVEILHQGKVAATLRGNRATDFVAEIEGNEPEARQQVMARITGNYKRGNERKASEHPRNLRDGS